MTELEMWRSLAIHALHDLLLIGIDITLIRGVTADIVRQVEEYGRSLESFA